MANYEKNGELTYVDDQGNEYVLLPKTKIENVDALQESLNSKLPIDGGTMSGAIAMGGKKITGLGTPTDAADAVPKEYADTKAPGGYGYGGYAIALPADGRTDSEAELETALAEIYGTMKDTETKFVYWNGYPASGTSTHGWFGILTRSSVNNGGFFGWSAYDAGTTIRKVKYNSTWQPLETFATTAYADTKLPKAGGTMTGAINMGSKKITNLATPTANTDAVTKAYADIGKLTLLWTNSSPTSSFGSQTVPSSGLSGYDYVLVCATFDVNNPQRTAACHIATVGGSYDGGYLCGRNPSSGAFVGRSFSVSTSGVAFTGGYTGTTSDNKYCIPFAIFGIKK